MGNGWRPDQPELTAGRPAKHHEVLLGQEPLRALPLQTDGRHLVDGLTAGHLVQALDGQPALIMAAQGKKNIYLETAVERGAACVLFVAWQGTTTSNCRLLRG